MNGTIIATVVWVLNGSPPPHPPSVLYLLQGHDACPQFALQFHNTPVHDPEDEAYPRTMDAGDWPHVTIRIRYGALGGQTEHEGIYLEAGSAYTMVDPETWLPVEMLVVDEHETGLACLELKGVS